MPSSAEVSRGALADLIGGRDLSEAQAYDLMGRVMAGEIAPAQLAGLLVALRCKGETVAEITGLARAMRENAFAVKPDRADLIDTCGTGGDGAGTFNISTATALVAAGMGCAVAKHGNRAVSSACGSADALAELGVTINLTPEQAASAIDEVGLGFLFAPGLHPAMRHAVPAREALGVRTVFNLLGPLTNPAGAPRQLLGVFDAALCETMARVLAALGSQRAYVVHGAGGLDEVSLLGTTHVAALENGVVRSFDFHPREVGLPTCGAADLQGGSVADNADIIRRVLAGEPGPARDVVVLNAAFVAVLAERAPDFRSGANLAGRVLDDGSAARILARLRRMSTDLAGGRV